MPVAGGVREQLPTARESCGRPKRSGGQGLPAITQIRAGKARRVRACDPAPAADTTRASPRDRSAEEGDPRALPGNPPNFTGGGTRLLVLRSGPMPFELASQYQPKGDQAAGILS